MKVSPHWHKETRIAHDANGREYALTCWGSSTRNALDAKADAVGKIERWIDRLMRGDKLSEYEYHTGELREELIDIIHDSAGNTIGAITRNRYGALVLNSAHVLIADIDVNPPGVIQRLGALLGRKSDDKTRRLNDLLEFAKKNQDWGMRIYETHSGLRVFLTHQPYEPDSEESNQILKSLGCDSLYHKLCITQNCYRARLTPKPWRCAATRPPSDFPRQTPEQRRAFDDWLEDYAEKSGRFAVCVPVECPAGGAMTEAARKVISAHDARAINSGARALA